MSVSSNVTSTVHGLLSAHAHGAGEAPAIGAPGRPFLSHGGLLAHVGAVTERLNALGIGAGQCVAVVLPNGPEMATAFLAITSAATCAPLNPAYREPEFEFFLGDLEPAALVVLRGVASPARVVAAARKIPILELDVAEGAPAGLFTLAGEAVGEARDSGLAKSDDVAMVLHTSGTTSRPKIVPLKHRNLAASARNIVETLELTPRDRCLNVMPLYHIHGLMAATLASMTAGASVVCAPGFDASLFFAWFAECRPTWYTAVPTIHQAALAAAGPHAKLIADVAMRFIRSSSAAMPPPVMAELERVMRAPLIEGYGMTEASHQMASNPLPPRVRKPGAVGLPTGIDIAIMNDAGDLLPDGERGEIVIRGASVIDAYQNNPKANETSFTNGWFRTGDQGFKDDDGYLTISGRLKEIINKAGEKISPREIDELLMKHPAVAQAVTFALPHPTLGEDVGAAVVLRPGASADEADLRQHCAASLAEFKIPQRVLVVTELPKGPTGKLKRIGLAEHFAEELAALPYAAPRTPLEKTLATVWAAELKHDRVGRDDNYFVLGGDSLQAVMLSVRAKAAEVAFSPADLFANPTIAALAAAIDARGPTAASPQSRAKDEALAREAAAAAGLDASIVEDAYGLTPFQHGLVAAYEPRLSPVAFQIAWTVRGLDPSLYRRALAEVVRRREALRTGFVKLASGDLVQFVRRDAEPVVSEVDLRAEPTEKQRDSLAALLASEHEKPFSLTEPPLFRATVARLTDDTTRLSCVFHHAVADLWSIGLFEREVAAVYDAIATGAGLAVSSPTSFRAFVDAELEAGSRDADATRAFWRRDLEGFPEAELTRFFRNSKGEFCFPSPARSVEAIELSPGLLEAVSAACRAAAVTPSTMHHGAFSIVASALAGADDVLFAAVFSGRWGTLAGLDEIVGPTMGTAPLRVRVTAETPLSTFLRALQQRLAELQVHSHVSWDEIARQMTPPRRALRAWCTLVVENLPEELWARPSKVLSFSEFSHRTHTRAPLMVSVFPGPSPRVVATFDPAFFAPEGARRMLAAFVSVLEAAAGGQEDLKMLREGVAKRVLDKG